MEKRYTVSKKKTESWPWLRPCSWMQSHFSCVWLSVSLWTIACHASLSMGFSRQEHWRGWPFPLPGIFPTQGSNQCVLHLLHCRQILFFFFLQADSLLLSQRWSQDHELLIAKFRIKLKKVGKTTRPFRYDLNQIPHDYTVKVRNRFKRLDLIEGLKKYGCRFMTLCRRQG